MEEKGVVLDTIQREMCASFSHVSSGGSRELEKGFQKMKGALAPAKNWPRPLSIDHTHLISIVYNHDLHDTNII